MRVLGKAMADEAVVALHTNDAQNVIPPEINECINFYSFSHFGWERLYKQFMSNVIKILGVHNDTLRLFLVRELVMTNNNFVQTLDRLKTKRLVQFPEALQLTNDHLKDILPDADPIYLDLVGEYFAFNQNGLNDLIEQITTRQKSYPKMHEYEEHLKLLKTIRSLTVEFNIEDFLRMCPDPVNYFKTVKINSAFLHQPESMSYLSEKFNRFPIAGIRLAMIECKFNLTDAVESLENNPNPIVLKNKRKTLDNVNHKNTNNIEFLKEKAFIEHKKLIINYIESKKAAHKMKFEEAKSTGSLFTCECCYNNEFLSSEIFSCPAGHSFCSSCINKGTEVAVGENKVDLKCFTCDKEFDVSMIKQIVDNKLYQRIMRLKQAQEIREAKIEGLETCAFCDYSAILPSEYKIIQCLNPVCRKETCRECREEGHVPYRCDQVEKAPEVEVRTMIENKMTEVLIRSCYYCNRKFVKEDGCNKMTCTCGKTMCYICRQPVQANYQHFYHESILPNRCPLYTDEDIVHNKAVEMAATLTLNKLKEEKPTLLGKIDINKLLPTIKKTVNGEVPGYSPINVNELLAKMMGQNVEDINVLDNLKSMEHLNKKPKH